MNTENTNDKREPNRPAPSPMMEDLGRIPNLPSAFVLTCNSKQRMRDALDRHCAISKEQTSQMNVSRPQERKIEQKNLRNITKNIQGGKSKLMVNGLEQREPTTVNLNKYKMKLHDIEISHTQLLYDQVIKVEVPIDAKDFRSYSVKGPDGTYNGVSYISNGDTEEVKTINIHLVEFGQEVNENWKFLGVSNTYCLHVYISD